MDAIDFLKKAKELCIVTNCASCKISMLCDGDPCSYRGIEQVVARVERWAEENTIKTNARFCPMCGAEMETKGEEE